MNRFYNSEQVKREIDVIKEMDHLNIVKIIKIEKKFKKYKIIMEYCEKGELYEYIVEKRRLKEEESAYYYFQLINGLEFIHSKNIVHRDLKPENLLITNDNILKIIDFGLCNYHDINNLLSTPCGSPSYASPEMVSGNKYNGIKVDIWCTGIILFAMLSGYLPFEAKDNYSLFKKIIKCEINYPDDISENALDLMKKILINDPSKRISINDIKKHPFYLEGKMIFGKIHGEYLDIREKAVGKRNKYKTLNRGELTERKREGGKNIFFKRKKNNLVKKCDIESKKTFKKLYEEIDLKGRKSTGSTLKKNILCFHISIDDNNKKQLFNEDIYLNKEKIFKKKNINNKCLKGFEKAINGKNICFPENNAENNIIKYIKPIMSPRDKERKIKFNEKNVYNSSKKENNKNTKHINFFNFKKIINAKNDSPLANSNGPYKRPTLKEASISLKKDYQNNQRNTVSSKRTIMLDNLYINASSNLTERNSVLVNRIHNIKRNRNDLINNSFVYKHKIFNTSGLKDDNDKYIYEKKQKNSKNLTLEEEENSNLEKNDMNIYYTLSSAKTKKPKNLRNNILFLPNLNQKINENSGKSLFNNIKINKSLLKPNNNQRNGETLKYPHYYGKTLDTQNDNNTLNSIKENINNYRKTINASNKEKIEELPNNCFINNNYKKVNSQKKIFSKRVIKDSDTSNIHSYILNNKRITLSNLPAKKKQIKALIFNNQINQLNIYKNDNNVNSYELNPIYFYNNSQDLKAEQNEVNMNPLFNKKEFNTIIINKRYQTEANDNEYDHQSININKDYKKIDNDNEKKNINNKKKVTSTIFARREKLDHNENKEDIKDKKSIFINSDINKKEKDYYNKGKILNIYF